MIKKESVILETLCRCQRSMEVVEGCMFVLVPIFSADGTYRNRKFAFEGKLIIPIDPSDEKPIRIFEEVPIMMPIQ